MIVGENNGNLDLFKLKNTDKQIIKYTNTDKIVNSYFIKQLRSKLNVSQLVFANIIGVSERKIRNWELGKGNPSASIRKLLFILDSDISLANNLYRVIGKK